MKTLLFILLFSISSVCFSQSCGYSCMTNSHVDRSDYRSGEAGYFQFDYNPDGWIDSDIIRVQFCERSGVYTITQLIVRTYGSLTVEEKTATTIKIKFTVPNSPNTDICLFIWGNIKGNPEYRYIASLNKKEPVIIEPVEPTEPEKPIITPPITTDILTPFNEGQKEGVVYYYSLNGELACVCPTKQKPNISGGLLIFKIIYNDNTYASGKINL